VKVSRLQQKKEKSGLLNKSLKTGKKNMLLNSTRNMIQQNWIKINKNPTYVISGGILNQNDSLSLEHFINKRQTNRSIELFSN